MLTVTVAPDDGEEFDVTIAARDTLVWEKTGKGNPSFLDFLRDMNMTDLYRLAHIAGTRQQLLNGQTLEEFGKAADVTPHFESEDDREPGPTGPGASPEPSSDSQSGPESPRPSGRKKASGQ